MRFQTTCVSGCTRHVILVLAALLCLARPAAASSIINVEGSTLGCFGAGCSNYTSPAVSGAPYSVTFTGSPFDVFTDAGGAATNIVLGTMSRGATNTPESTPALPFTLQVIFTLPVGITGGQTETFSALIKGTNNPGAGPLDVDFDNAWQLLEFQNAFGSGSFEFSVIDDLRVTRNSIVNPPSILGGIRNATFTPTQTTVPEPATLMLFGVGLAGAAYRRRQRDQR